MEISTTKNTLHIKSNVQIWRRDQKFIEKKKQNEFSTKKPASRERLKILL